MAKRDLEKHRETGMAPPKEFILEQNEKWPFGRRVLGSWSGGTTGAALGQGLGLS